MQRAVMIRARLRSVMIVIIQNKKIAQLGGFLFQNPVANNLRHFCNAFGQT